MKKFLTIYFDWITPISLVIGNFLLLYVFFCMMLQSSDGWIASVACLVCWLYGCTFHSQVIPFFQRLMSRFRRNNVD